MGCGEAAGGVEVGSHTLEDLHTHIHRLRELGRTAREAPTEEVPLEELLQRLDEGLFDVLYGVALTLSSVNTLLQSPPGPACEDAQLQLLTVTPSLHSEHRPTLSQTCSVCTLTSIQPYSLQQCPWLCLSLSRVWLPSWTRWPASWALRGQRLRVFWARVSCVWVSWAGSCLWSRQAWPAERNSCRPSWSRRTSTRSGPLLHL